MRFLSDSKTLWLAGGVGAVLVLASLAGWILKHRVRSDSGRATVANLNARIRAWWIMCAVFFAAMLTGGIGSLILFGLLSFWPYGNSSRSRPPGGATTAPSSGSSS